MNAEDVQTCDPVIYNANISQDLHSYGGIELDPEEVAYPCGRIAKYFFNDKFEYFDEIGEQIEEEDIDVTWTKFDEHKFKNLKVNSARYQHLDISDGHVISWFKIDTYPDFD